MNEETFDIHVEEIVFQMAGDCSSNFYKFSIWQIFSTPHGCKTCKSHKAAKVIPESSRATTPKCVTPEKKTVAQIILAKVDLFTQVNFKFRALCSTLSVANQGLSGRSWFQTLSRVWARVFCSPLLFDHVVLHSLGSKCEVSLLMLWIIVSWMLKINVVLPNGHAELLSLLPSAKMQDLRTKAQRAFGKSTLDSSLPRIES